MKAVNDQLIVEAMRKLQDMEHMEIGTEEYQNAANSVKTLIDEAVEIQKEKRNRRDEVHKWIDSVTKVLGTTAKFVLPVWMTYVTLRYEDENIMTREAGKTAFKFGLNFFNNK